MSELKFKRAEGRDKEGGWIICPSVLERLKKNMEQDEFGVEWLTQMEETEQVLLAIERFGIEHLIDAK